MMARGVKIIHERLPIRMEKLVGFFAEAWYSTNQPVCFPRPFALEVEETGITNTDYR